ncbi:MAG: endonuclease III [Firmicutes bacterium]|nr:endonuclease III [Bacillota bacterium]
MNNRVKEIFVLLGESYPQAGSGLKFKNPFQLFVATVLSAQTTDRQVNRITKELFAWVKGPEELAALEPGQLEPYLKGCGLYRNKSRYLVAAAQKIVDDYGGEIPGRFEELISLPGVGRKTANVILSAAFGIPALAVDTHVYRVSRRLGLAKGNTAAKVERELTELLPPEIWIAAHHRLIAHGRRVCRARGPRCRSCVLEHLCPASELLLRPVF